MLAGPAMDTAVKPAVTHSPWQDLTVPVKTLASHSKALSNKKGAVCRLDVPVNAPPEAFVYHHGSP